MLPATAPLPAHTPVLLAEVLEALGAALADPAAPGRPPLYVDATLGLGGHAEALLERGARVLGIDRDAEALELARARLAARAGDRLRLIHGDYRHLLAILAREGTGPVDGVLADLGVSAYQLLSPERGFTLRGDGPLDMRMDRTEPTPTAADLLATLGEGELARLLHRLGEEPQARRIARAVVEQRARAPLTTTAELVRLIEAVKPGRGRSRAPLHPATQAFQALRIAVNDELTGIDRFVKDAVSALRRGARVAVIAFHSLEDRQVKRALRELEQGCVCPPDLPVCGCGRKPALRLLWRRPRRPGPAEREANPRARSARLRAAEKIGDELAPGLGAAA